ncbi:hypothetical protein [Longitalea arenae]|uniref:hypothetical protein n=1 Tax=Longitalea arenae TaxID=2812558 RepID=UPI001968820D|nr:hypothetical protein [Longitalea arenae]
MSQQVNTADLSKKQISQIVQHRLANSLDGFHLSGKKFDARLKKASKVFAAMIAKENRKQKKAQQ